MIDSGQPDRRRFLGGLLGGALAAAFDRSAWAAEPPASRRMTIDLVPGNLGVKATQREAIDLAQRHGFESVFPIAAELAVLSDRELGELHAELEARKLVFGAAFLAVDFRRDDATFEQGLLELPAYARALQRAGVRRTGTWLPPSSDSLTYLQYFKQTASRLRQVARVLGEHEVRLGLEYVGPRTAWTVRRYPFLHTLAETRDLIAEIGLPNVGLVLDSWHWFHAGDTVADIQALRNEHVVAVDLNDAPSTIPKDQQKDGARELPMATGVIDVGSFLKALLGIGYDGPVRAEPFNEAVRRMPPEEAVAATSQAMKKAFALVGG
jgi:sugar phosphate isomerase/epimerase